MKSDGRDWQWVGVLRWCKQEVIEGFLVDLVIADKDVLRLMSILSIGLL